MTTIEQARALAARIKLMAFDVDGVLTDGSLYISDEGIETKVFNTRDGHGLRMLQKAGIKLAIITGRRARCVELRMKDLGIEPLVFAAVPRKEVEVAVKPADAPKAKKTKAKEQGKDKAQAPAQDQDIPF